MVLLSFRQNFHRYDTVLAWNTVVFRNVTVMVQAKLSQVRHTVLAWNPVVFRNYTVMVQAKLLQVRHTVLAWNPVVFRNDTVMVQAKLSKAQHFRLMFTKIIIISSHTQRLGLHLRYHESIFQSVFTNSDLALITNL